MYGSVGSDIKTVTVRVGESVTGRFEKDGFVMEGGKG